MIAPSIDKAKPAPRDSHTEKVSLLSPANLGSMACFHLFFVLALLKYAPRFYLPPEREHGNMKAME